MKNKKEWVQSSYDESIKSIPFEHLLQMKLFDVCFPTATGVSILKGTISHFQAWCVHFPGTDL